MKKIAEYKITVLKKDDYKKIVPHFWAIESGGFANQRTKKAYIRDTGNKKLNNQIIEHEMEELLVSNSPHEYDGIRYGFFSDLWEDVKDVVSDVWDPVQEHVIDPLKGVIGEKGVGAGLGTIASLGLAPFTGGASLALMPYMAAGGGMIGGAMEEEGNLLQNILTGGLTGYGMGTMGAELGGIDVANIFGGAGTLPPPGGFDPNEWAKMSPQQQQGLWQNLQRINPALQIPGGGGDLLQDLLGRARGLFGGEADRGAGIGGGLDIGNILSAMGGGGAMPGGAGGYGGGYFPGVEMEIPPAPQYPTAEELFGEAGRYAREEFPLAYGAREEALRELPGLEVGPEYFEQYGPTSFEEAIASKYFQYAAPEARRAIAHRMSLMGMGESPITAELIGRETGRLGVDIGQYLAGLGQRRGELALRGREQALREKMALRPQALMEPYATTMARQTGLEAGAGYENLLRRSMADYLANVGKAQESAAKRGTLWGLGGTLGGTLLGQPQLGSDIGGILGTLAGGTGWPIGGGAGGGFNLQDILSKIGLDGGQAQPVQPTQPQKRWGAIEDYLKWSPFEQFREPLRFQFA